MGKSYLVTGLESSCTRYVSILLARNLGVLPDGETWNGHDRIHRGGIHVFHRSLPHGGRDNYIDEDFWMSFDVVILCTRDLVCSLESKVKWHQADRNLAVKEQEKAAGVAASILNSHGKVEIYSYESAFLLGRAYNETFFRRIGVPYSVHEETVDVNSKYFLRSPGSS